MSIELTWWIKHQKHITTRLVATDKNVVICYSGLLIEVNLRHWFLILDEDTLVDFPKPQLLQQKEKRQVVGEQSK
jgi:hypothetical protein